MVAPPAGRKFTRILRSWMDPFAVFSMFDQRELKMASESVDYRDGLDKEFVSALEVKRRVFFQRLEED